MMKSLMNVDYFCTHHPIEEYIVLWVSCIFTPSFISTSYSPPTWSCTTQHST